MHVYPIYYKNFYFFSLLYIRMSGNSINFNDKKIKKSDFYNKNKKIYTTLTSIKYQSLEKNNTANIIHLNTLLGIMIMLLDHYIYLFHKRLDILINLKKIK